MVSEWNCRYGTLLDKRDSVPSLQRELFLRSFMCLNTSAYAATEGCTIKPTNARGGGGRGTNHDIAQTQHRGQLTGFCWLGVHCSTHLFWSSIWRRRCHILEIHWFYKFMVLHICRPRNFSLWVTLNADEISTNVIIECGIRSFVQIYHPLH